MVPVLKSKVASEPPFETSDRTIGTTVGITI